MGVYDLYDDTPAHVAGVSSGKMRRMCNDTLNHINVILSYNKEINAIGVKWLIPVPVFLLA